MARARDRLRWFQPYHLWAHTVEITVFKRGITLFMSGDERVRRIHRVLCRLDKE
ncbi:MAG: hypothetical protein Q8Q12_16460 [bacterium]|nr:hypothetical protein [bacterium]